MVESYKNHIGKLPMPKFPLSQKEIDYWAKEIGWGRSVKGIIYQNVKWPSPTQFFKKAFEKPIVGYKKDNTEVTQWQNKLHPFYPVYYIVANQEERFERFRKSMKENREQKKLRQIQQKEKPTKKVLSNPPPKPSVLKPKPKPRINPKWEKWMKTIEEHEIKESQLHDLAYELNGLSEEQFTINTHTLIADVQDGKINLRRRVKDSDGGERGSIDDEVQKILAKYRDVVSYFNIKWDGYNLSMDEVKLPPRPRGSYKRLLDAEDQSAYWFLKGEMQSRAPLNQMDLEQILEMLQNVPAKEMNEAMEQAEMMGDEAAMIVLVMADNKRKFREEYASEDEPSVEKLKSYFSRLKSQNPDLARKIEFSVKNEEELPTEEIEKAGFQEDKIEEWVDLVGVEDSNLVGFEICSDCEGEGFIITNYYPATRYDPADGDFEECEICYGSGEIDPADYMDKDGNYMAESFESETKSMNPYLLGAGIFALTLVFLSRKR